MRGSLDAGNPQHPRTSGQGNPFSISQKDPTEKKTHSPVGSKNLSLLSYKTPLPTLPSQFQSHSPSPSNLSLSISPRRRAPPGCRSGQHHDTKPGLRSGATGVHTSANTPTTSSTAPPIIRQSPSGMGISKTEVNLKRLLAAAPQQQNQAKLVHYVATLREQLEQLAEEKTPEGLPRISKATLNDYSEKIEAIASKLVNHVSDLQVSEKDFERKFVKENPSEIEEKKQIPLSSGLRRRPVPASSTEDRAHEPAETDHLSPVKLDAAAHAHIDKHRMLQEDLTDEMVVLAKQLKESSLMMSQSVQNTEKILDSTEQAIEHSLASTGRANVRATTIYSESFKTSCLTWLVMFVMTCVFVMVVLLIRVT